MNNSPEYSRQYKAEKVGQINISGSKEWLEQVKAYATARGMKTNTFIKNLIIEEIQRRPIDQLANVGEVMQDVKRLQEQEAGSGATTGTDQGQERGTEVTQQLHENVTQVKSDCNQQEQTGKVCQQIKNDIINAIITALQGLRE